MKDGWKVVNGYKVYVEDGFVTRAVDGEGNDQHTVYPYRWSDKNGCWSSTGKITTAALRAGLNRGTIKLA